MNRFESQDQEARRADFNKAPLASDTEVGLSAPQNSPNFFAELAKLPEDRKHLIFRIRRQISEKTYDTPQNLEVALERLFDSLDD